LRGDFRTYLSYVFLGGSSFGAFKSFWFSELFTIHLITVCAVSIFALTFSSSNNSSTFLFLFAGSSVLAFSIASPIALICA